MATKQLNVIWIHVTIQDTVIILVSLRVNAMVVDSWHLAGVGPTLAMVLARRCTHHQFPLFFLISRL
jgi:microcystin degradation protein MlrC